MRFLLFIWFLLPFGSLAQTLPVDAVTGKIYYAEEVLVKDGPQVDLYHRAKTWFASEKNKSTLLVDDPANGLLIGSCYLPIKVNEQNKSHTFHLIFKIKLELADDQYWYSLFDFEWQEEDVPQQPKSVTAQTTRQPLEALIYPNNGKEQNSIYHQKLENTFHNIILTLIAEFKSSML